MFHLVRLSEDIKELKNRIRKKKIINVFRIYSISAILVSFVGILISSYFNNKLALILFLIIYFTSPIPLFIGSWIKIKMLTIGFVEEGIAILYDLSNKIEKYQDTNTSSPNKKELEKEVVSYLHYLEKLIHDLEKFSKRYIFPNYYLKTVNFLENFLYKLNHAIKQNITIDNSLLTDIRNFCIEEIKRIEEYEENSINSQENIMQKIDIAITEMDKELFGKHQLVIFKKHPILARYIIFTILPLFIIWFSFQYVLTNFYKLSDSDIVMGTVLAWTAVIILLSPIIGSRK